MRFVLVVSAFALALAFALYLPTLRCQFAYDDIDYINLAGKVLAGKAGYWQTLFHPHAEHLVAGFQALFFAYLSWFGLDAFVWRIAVVVVHVASAVFLALLARRYAESGRAGIATAAIYVGACGFSSLWVWFPSGATVVLMMALLTGSAALLAWRNHLTLRRVIAGAGVVLALLTESSFAPMALLPAVIDEYERRREGRRGIGVFSVFTAMSIAGTVALVLWLSRGQATSISIDFTRGVPRGVFLVLAAPFRFFFPSVPISASTPARFAMFLSALGCIVLSAILALLVTLWRRGIPRLAVIAVLTLPASLGVLTLIGLGRWNLPYPALYETDRYFFSLLVPLSLTGGAVVASISLAAWSRLPRILLLTCVAIMLLGELALQRRAMYYAFPRIVYDRHAVRFASLARLTGILDRAGPIELPRQALWFTDVHNAKVHTPVLTAIICGHGRCPNVRLGDRTVDTATAARLNPLLDQWARESDEPVPLLRVVDGRIVNTRIRWGVDFAHGDFEGQGLRGFGAWQKPARWMSGRGEVPLSISPNPIDVTLAAPMSAAVTVRAALIDDDTKLTFPIGSAIVTGHAPQKFSFSTAPYRSRLGLGRTARLVLTCDRTWTVAGDCTPRCVQVFSAITAPDE